MPPPNLACPLTKTVSSAKPSIRTDSNEAVEGAVGWCGHFPPSVLCEHRAGNGSMRPLSHQKRLRGWEVPHHTVPEDQSETPNCNEVRFSVLMHALSNSRSHLEMENWESACWLCCPPWPRTSRAPQATSCLGGRVCLFCSSEQLKKRGATASR